MDAAIRHLVHQRAGECCEYCRLPQEAVDATFHVEHIIALQHGGNDDPSNLALACDRCNLYKGPNLTSVDLELEQSFHYSIHGRMPGNATLLFAARVSSVSHREGGPPSNS